jgi:large subunit ribosomal protein L10
MAISKTKKNEKVALLSRELEGSTTAIVGTFTKLTVAKDFELRKTIRDAGGKYRVVKNKLAAVSGKGTQVEAALKGLKGVIDAAEVKALATMPGKEELFSKLLFLINAPAQRLVTVLNATGRDLAVVLGQGVEKEKFAGAA